MTSRAHAMALAVLLSLTAAAPAQADTDPVGVWPLHPEPAVVRGFEPPASPYGPGHRGVDLLGEPGQPVGSGLAGTVTYAGMLAGRGVVVVSHGATRTTYEPVTATVMVGQPVAAGATVGTLGLTGFALLPARLPALGMDRRGGLPRPAPAGRARPGAAAAALAGRAGGEHAGRPGLPPARQARGWAWRYAARSRSVVTCV